MMRCGNSSSRSSGYGRGRQLHRGGRNRRRRSRHTGVQRCRFLFVKAWLDDGRIVRRTARACATDRRGMAAWCLFHQGREASMAAATACPRARGADWRRRTGHAVLRGRNRCRRYGRAVRRRHLRRTDHSSAPAECRSYPQVHRAESVSAAPAVAARPTMGRQSIRTLARHVPFRRKGAAAQPYWLFHRECME